MLASRRRGSSASSAAMHRTQTVPTVTSIAGV